MHNVSNVSCPCTLGLGGGSHSILRIRLTIRQSVCSIINIYNAKSDNKQKAKVQRGKIRKKVCVILSIY